MSENPYAAPRTRVEDVPEQLPEGDFLPEGRGVSAGNGWRWIADAWAFTGDQRWTFIGVVLLLALIQIGAQFVPVLGPLAVALLSPKSGICSRAFSGIAASSSPSVRSRSRSASLRSSSWSSLSGCRSCL